MWIESRLITFVRPRFGLEIFGGEGNAKNGKRDMEHRRNLK